MRQLAFACRAISAKIFSLFVAMLLVVVVTPAGLASSQVLEDYQSPLFTDLKLPVYSWMLTNSSPKAIIIALHGGCLHGRSFRTLGQTMAARNYMVVSLDMRGYGAWYHEGFGSKEDRQFNYKISEADVLQLIAQLRTYFPDAPVFVLGESLGANMAEILLTDAPDLLAGGVMVNPYVKLRVFVHPYMPITFLSAITRPLGRLNVAPYLKGHLSDDRKQALAQINDPLSRNEQSIKELGQSLMFNIKGRHSALAIPANKPLLFVVGQRDRLCNPKATEQLYKKISNDDKTLVLLKDKGHLLVETTEIRTDIIEVMDQWLNAHVK